MPSLSVDCVCDEHGLLALQSAWDALLGQSSQTSVFLRHEWFEAAWHWLKRETQPPELTVLCVRQGERLIGICPLIRRRLRKAGLIELRTLELLAVPDTQLADFVCAAPDVGRVCAAVAGYLAATARTWDRLDLHKIAPESPAAALGAAMQAIGLRVETTSNGTNPYLALDGNWQAYYGRRSRRLKKGNNLVSNKLHKAFRNVAIRRFPHDDHAVSIDDLLTSITAISAASWKNETTLTLDQPGPGAFIRRLSELALARGWLSVYLLHLDDQPVAMEYQLVHDGDVHALRADFRADYAEHSPGTYLNHKLLEHLFGAVHGRYWMGPGNNPYKLRWREAEQPLLRVRAYSPSARGALLGTFERVRKRVSAARRASAAEPKQDEE